MQRVGYGNRGSVLMGWVQESGWTRVVPHPAIRFQGSEGPHRGNGTDAETGRCSETVKGGNDIQGGVTTFLKTTGLKHKTFRCS